MQICSAVSATYVHFVARTENNAPNRESANPHTTLNKPIESRNVAGADNVHNILNVNKADYNVFKAASNRIENTVNLGS
jgi:hypothetical protein